MLCFKDQQTERGHIEHSLRYDLQDIIALQGMYSLDYLHWTLSRSGHIFRIWISELLKPLTRLSVILSHY